MRLSGLRAKDGSINRAKDVSPLRDGTLRSLLRSYKTRICNIFQSMFRQAQHDRRCYGLICEFADSRIPKPWFVSAQSYIKIKRGLTPSTQNYYRNKRLNPIDMHIGHIHTCLRYFVAQGKIEILTCVGVDHFGV